MSTIDPRWKPANYVEAEFVRELSMVLNIPENTAAFALKRLQHHGWDVSIRERGQQ